MRKKKPTQQLVSIESVTDSSVLTAGGELTFYLVQPTTTGKQRCCWYPW